LHRRIFKPSDYRQEVFEDVLLRADKELAAELKKQKIANEEGKVIDEKALSALWSSGLHSDIFSLIGIRGDNVARQKYFTPYDVNLGNVMMAEKDGVRSYTHIDFEDSREESLESLLFRRWARSGIYDHKGGSSLMQDGRSAEDALLSNAYETVARLHRIDGTQAPSFDEFASEFRMNKKKSLLRFAASYRTHESGADSERARAHKRFFYTLFVRELEKEGKSSDAALEYLNMLFENPLSEEEMSVVAEKYSPKFSSLDISLEAELKKQDIDERVKSAVQDYRDERHVRRRNKVLIAVGVLGLAALAYVGFSSASEEKQAAEKAQQEKAQVERRYDLESKAHILAKLDSGVSDFDTELADARIFAFDEFILHDRQTARAAYVDVDAVYEAVAGCGRTDWPSVKAYLDEHGRFDVIFTSEKEDGGYVDSWVHQGVADNVQKEWTGAARRYDARKAQERRPDASRGINLPVGVGNMDLADPFPRH
jgi:hypothetical protein